MSHSFYTRYGKRALDLTVAIPVIVLSSPLLVLIGLIIRVTSRGSVLFRQKRLGRGATPFDLVKFRTMLDRPRLPDVVAYSGDPSEITRIGRILRRSKLDELPQFFNVLRGEMSLVGPRPQLPIQLAEFDANGMKRLLASPGLTGMAQTHGNVFLTWPERWAYDAFYVDHISLRLDLWLMARTLGVLVHGDEKYLKRPKLGATL